MRSAEASCAGLSRPPPRDTLPARRPGWQHCPRALHESIRAETHMGAQVRNHCRVSSCRCGASRRSSAVFWPGVNRVILQQQEVARPPVPKSTAPHPACSSSKTVYTRRRSECLHDASLRSYSMGEALSRLVGRKPVHTLL